MPSTANLDSSAIGYVYVNSGSGEVNLGAIRTLTYRIDGKERPHYDRSGYPIGIDKIVKGAPLIELEFEWEEVGDASIWAKVLHGVADLAATSDGTQAVTDEALVMNGRYDVHGWNQLTYGHVFDADCAVVVTSEAGGGDTYTVDVDYVIDKKAGHLGRINGGSITDGQTVYVDYVYETHDGYTFEVMSDSVPVEYAIRVEKPLEEGDNLRIRHTKAVFSLSQEMSLNPGDEGEWAGVSSKITLLKHDSTYGYYGDWSIYTP
jgi:hypothetical protein